MNFNPNRFTTIMCSNPECGRVDPLTPAQLEWSKRKYGVPLCRNCQEKYLLLKERKII